MVLTWLLTMAGFVIIFVEIGGWSQVDNPHAILGVVTTVLCFLQPIGAYFRPHPGTKRRPLFNWLHWLGGNLAHIIAIVAIFFAVKLQKAELPEWLDFILVAFVAFHVFMHLIFSVSCAVLGGFGKFLATMMKNFIIFYKRGFNFEVNVEDLGSRSYFSYNLAKKKVSWTKFQNRKSNCLSFTNVIVTKLDIFKVDVNKRHSFIKV